MDHYLRPNANKKHDVWKPKTPLRGPEVENPEQPWKRGTPASTCSANTTQIPEEPVQVVEKKGGATDEEKREGVKQLLAMLRSQKKDKREKVGNDESIGASDDATKPKKKGKKKMMIKDGNLIVISVNEDGEATDEAEQKKTELLHRIVQLAEEGNFEEVEALTRDRLAELHGTTPIRNTSKVNLLKALKTGDAELQTLKKTLFRISEGLHPKGFEFMLEPGYWEEIAGGVVHVTDRAPSPSNTPVHDRIRPDTVSAWQKSLTFDGYFHENFILGRDTQPEKEEALDVRPELFVPGQEVEREIDNTFYPAVVRSRTPPSSPGECHSSVRVV